MKNFKIIMVVLLLALPLFLFACVENPEVSCYVNAKSYINYAEDVYFDYEVHPELVDNGLFWMRYDEEQQKVVGVNINDKETIDELGTALVDPNKPTIINIHGVQQNSYNWSDIFSKIYLANKKILPPEVYGHEKQVDMNRIWLDGGYNVLNYIYSRFADGPLFVNGIAMNKNIEAKVWGIDGPQKMRYRLKDGTFNCSYNGESELIVQKYPELEYCLAEYFVADYIRAFNSVEGLCNNEIRIVAHSMGGVVTAASSFLLSELSKTGQVPLTYLPDRLAILDGYIGIPASNSELDKMLSNNQLSIRWTGNKVKDVGTVDAYLSCVRQLVEKFDMPIEYYVDKKGTVPQVAGEWFDFVRPYCAVAYFDMEIKGFASYHNSIREMYTGSFASDNPPRDITDETNIGYSISAKSSIEDIKSLRGVEFMLVEGKNSGNTKDHAFVRIK